MTTTTLHLGLVALLQSSAAVAAPAAAPSARVQAPQDVPAPPRPQSAASAPTPTLARRIPGAMVFLHCGDLTELDRKFEHLSISKLGNDPEIWEFLRSNPEIARFEKADPNKVAAPILAWYQSLAASAGIPEKLMQEFCGLLQSGFGLGEMSVAITPPSREARERPMHDGGVFALMSAGKEPARVDSLLSGLVEHVRAVAGESKARRTAIDNVSFFEFGDPQDPELPTADPVFCVARRGGSVFVAAPRAENMVQLLGRAPEACLGDDPNFREANATLGATKDAMYMYIDGPRLLSSVTTGRQQLRIMGMDRLRWIGLTMEADGANLRHRVEVRADVTGGVPTLFSAKDQFDLASALPDRTIACVQMALDGPHSYRALENVVAMQGAKAALEFERKMAEMRERLGMDLQEALELLGDEAAVAVVPPESGLIPDFFFLAKAKDPAAAARCRALIEQSVRRNSPNTRVRESMYQGQKISYAQAQGSVVFPSLVVDGDLMVVGSNLSAAKRWIQFRKGGGAALAARAAYRDSIASVTSGSATGYVWIDWPSIANFAYVNFSSFAPMLLAGRGAGMDPGDEDPSSESASEPAPADEFGEAMFGLHGPRFDWSKMPSAETVIRYITPQAIRVRVGSQGLSLDSRAFF